MVNLRNDAKDNASDLALWGILYHGRSFVLAALDRAVAFP